MYSSWNCGKKGVESGAHAGYSTENADWVAQISILEANAFSTLT